VEDGDLQAQTLDMLKLEAIIEAIRSRMPAAAIGVPR
jgi:hypothetical protein